MAFTDTNVNVVKQNYNVFWSPLNKSKSEFQAILDTTDADLFFGNYPSNPTELIYTSGTDYTMSNSSPDLLIVTSASTVLKGSVTDGKPRIIYNGKSTGNITCGSDTIAPKESILFFNNDFYNDKTSLLPLGTCLSEPSMFETKGEEIQIGEGDFLTVERESSCTFTLPGCDRVMVDYMNSFSIIGILFVEIGDKVSRIYHFPGLAPLLTLTVKSNAVNEMVFDVKKMTPAKTYGFEIIERA